MLKNDGFNKMTLTILDYSQWDRSCLLVYFSISLNLTLVGSICIHLKKDVFTFKQMYSQSSIF